MKKQNTSNINIFLLAVALVAIGVAIFTVVSKDDVDKDMRADETHEKVLVEKSFDYMNSTEWERSEDFLESASSLVKDQVITGILQDPNDANIFYISTLGDREIPEGELGALPTAHMTSIYKYSYDSREWERLYRERIDTESKPQLREGSLGRYTVVGYDSGRLVLALESWIGNDGCYSPINGSHNHSDLLDILSMDLKYPYDEFIPYELPDDVVKKAQREVEECVKMKESYESSL